MIYVARRLKLVEKNKKYVKHVEGARILIKEAYYMVVMLYENERQVPVLPMLPESEKEMKDYGTGEYRHEMRKA